MQRYLTLCALPFALACTDGSNGESSFSGNPQDAAFPGDAGPGEGDATPGEDGPGGAPGIDDDAGVVLDPGEASLLHNDAVGIIGVTADNHVVYRASDGLRAASVAQPGDTELISEKGGTVLVRGHLVFQWSDLDWTTNLGQLTVWSASRGARSIGVATYGEDAVAVSASGEYFMYMTPAGRGTVDLHAATADLSRSAVVMPAIGRGAPNTCRPSIGFVWEEAIVASCEKGKTGASLKRFAEPVFESEATELAAGIRPLWSSDFWGSSIFYVDEQSRAFYWEAGESTEIDRGVAWGTIVPNGTAVLYTVGDQLRRAEVPDGVPIPVVVNGFLVRTDFSPQYTHVLFSREVVYGGGTRRDLYLATTDAPSSRGTELVGDPEAVLSKSTFSTDGRWALYLTEMGDGGSGTLNAVPVGAGEATHIQGVDTVMAGPGGVVVFSDNRSDPAEYPITADLSAIDLATGQKVAVRQGVMDGRNFALTADKGAVVYILPRPEDPEAGPEQGIYVQPLF